MTTFTETVEGAEIPTPGYTATLTGGGTGTPRFKSGEDPLITKIRGDIEMISKDKREVRGLDTIATMPVTTGLRGGDAFLEMKEKKCDGRKDEEKGTPKWCLCNKEKALIVKEEDCTNEGGERSKYCKWTGNKCEKCMIPIALGGCINGGKPAAGTPAAGKPAAGTTDISTKAKDALKNGGSFGTEAGTGKDNKVADSMLTEAPKVGDMTAVASGTSTKTVVDTQNTDFSKVDVDEGKILTDLEKKPRSKEAETELTNAGVGLAPARSGTQGFFDTEGNKYVDELIRKGPKTKPADVVALSKIAAEHSRSGKVNNAVALMDKRLQWLKDAMKEMSKYYIWASAELKRDVTVQTITDKKTYDKVLSTLQHDQQETALDSKEILVKMMEAYTAVSNNIEMIERKMGYAKSVIVQFEGLLVEIEGVTADATKQCTKMKPILTEWKTVVDGVPEKGDGKAECDIIGKNIVKVLKDCDKDPSKGVQTAMKPFKAEFFGTKEKPGTKEQFLKQFREVFAIYEAILAAFRTASGQ